MGRTHARSRTTAVLLDINLILRMLPYRSIAWLALDFNDYVLVVHVLRNGSAHRWSLLSLAYFESGPLQAQLACPSREIFSLPLRLLLRHILLLQAEIGIGRVTLNAPVQVPRASRLLSDTMRRPLCVLRRHRLRNSDGPRLLGLETEYRRTVLLFY